VTVAAASKLTITQFRRVMRGIILAGGNGTRLRPLTTVVNKHLLPVYNKPMIYYPIQSMVNSGIKDILLVCGGQNAGDFLRIIGNGSEFGLKHIAYTYQKEAGGIAHALALAEHWADGDNICVMLGDNILQNSFPEAVEEFNNNPVGARIFITHNDNPEWYGVVTLDGSVVKEIIEKPKKPKSNWIAIGLYIYDSTVWGKLKGLRPSKRNELEITDLNNIYLKAGKLKANKITGYWGDAGESIDTYLTTSVRVRDMFKS
jgi:glucose-1-phosphate thymidylyltransferase